MISELKPQNLAKISITSENASYAFELDLEAVVEAEEVLEYLDWVRLDFHKCHNCTLEKKKYCPAAMGLMHIIPRFANLTSTDTVSITYSDEGGHYTKTTTGQQALASCILLNLMVSGCPSFLFLRNAWKIWNPIIEFDSAVFHIFAYYLVYNYNSVLKGQAETIEFSTLQNKLLRMRDTLEGFIQRVRSIQEADANVNAIVILHSLLRLLEDDMVVRFTDLLDNFFPKLHV